YVYCAHLHFFPTRRSSDLQPSFEIEVERTDVVRIAAVDAVDDVEEVVEAAAARGPSDLDADDRRSRGTRKNGSDAVCHGITPYFLPTVRNASSPRSRCSRSCVAM